MTKKCKTILVVEDDIQIQRTLKDVLEFEGHRVITADNGKEAIETLKNVERPCLILLDMMMPVMNGWEFLALRKASDVLMTIPVAIVSAAESKELKAAGSVEAVIKKPIDLEMLLNWVNYYCGNS